jgi:adenine deaminase
MRDISRLLAAARGDAPADLLLTHGRIVNVFTGEIESLDIAIIDGLIAGIGTGYRSREQVDLKHSYVAPGFIDAHVHIESSLCTPAQFAAAVVPRGVTTAVVDPHEIANVAGAKGVRFMAESGRGLPLDLIVMAPSCVPATSLAGGGGVLDAADIESLRRDGTAHGLAEVMNYPAVLAGHDQMLEKLSAMSGRPIDGHCPGVSGNALNAYVAAGIGSDHESVTVNEAREKLSRGLYLLIREATNARNLDALLPLVNRHNSRRICFCTDDRTAGDLLNIGSIDHMVRRAIATGIDPIDAIRMATLNPAEWFGLSDIGAIAPGKKANLIVFDDITSPRPRMVFKDGKRCAENGMLTGLSASADSAATPLGRCEVDWSRVSFNILAKSDRIRVIGSLPDQLVTEHRILPVHKQDGRAVADVRSDLLKMAVIDRHGATGQMGLGFIQSFGLRRGAIAGTVAHDHHNLITIGADDLSMHTAARAAASNGGGLAVAVGEHIVAHLPLPIGGLMSDRPIAEVANGYQRLIDAAHEFGSSLSDPYMAMSFMALEVIPSLKLTEQGLVDVDKFQIVDLFV